jgi:hypothetical protein
LVLVVLENQVLQMVLVRLVQIQYFQPLLLTAVVWVEVAVLLLAVAMVVQEAVVVEVEVEPQRLELETLLQHLQVKAIMVELDMLYLALLELVGVVVLPEQLVATHKHLLLI